MIGMTVTCDDCGQPSGGCYMCRCEQSVYAPLCVCDPDCIDCGGLCEWCDLEAASRCIFRLEAEEALNGVGASLGAGWFYQFADSNDAVGPFPSYELAGANYRLAVRLYYMGVRE